MIQDSYLKKRINDRLIRIANVLLLNASFTDNIRFLNGKMGIALFYYQYSRYASNKIFEDYAGELIDEIYEEINSNTPVDFANGLTGIGLGIKYLRRNGFVAVEINEAQADIDNAVHRSSLTSPNLLDNGNDLFSYGFYYNPLLQGRTNDDDNQNLFLKKQHLIYLIDFCEQILVQKQQLRLDTINSITWFLLEMHGFGLFPEKVEGALSNLPDYIESHLQSATDRSGQFLLFRLTENIITSVADISLQKTLRTILKKKNGKVSYTIYSEEIMVCDFMKITWQRIVYMPYKKYEDPLKELSGKIFSIVDDEENWKRRLNKLNNNNLGLTGFDGLGLGILFERI
jgi:hypothetical protein